VKPLAIDLFCGLGGWTDGLLAEGYDVIGFDIEQHQYGEHRYPAQLVVQDVLTLHGSQFKDAALIVASPPCQAYSYRAMPWKRAKALPPPCNALFEACFRIQREASEAAGRHIPLIVENVRGAQKWVGRARWNFGSFYLWGDVPALMPITFKGSKVPGFRFDGSGKSFQSESVKLAGCGANVPGIGWTGFAKKEGGVSWRNRDDIKNTGGSWFNIAHNTTSGKGRNPDGRKTTKDGLGGYGGNFGWDDSPMRRGNSKSPSRKFTSAMIAKIPLPLSRYIAATFRPTLAEAAE
jgi:C-5 cytosine-specific DNA methylase